jgi:hypothetical protein
MNNDEIRNDPQWQEWEANVREGLVPMIDQSAYVMTLVPENDPDIKFAVELGLTIMMEKPLIVIAYPGRRVPPKLEQIADHVLRIDEDRPVQEQVQEAMRAVMSGDSHD